MAVAQQRGAATRALLLDAALECLVEYGYTATSTVEVARRAGVSRGAQLHHFPTKAQLLTAALDHLLSRRIEEFRKAFADLDPNVDARDGAIDLLWRLYQGPSFVAWVELWLAARSDPELHQAMLDVDRRFGQEAIELYHEALPPPAGVEPWIHEIAPIFAFALMDGLALRGLVTDHWGPVRSADIIEAFKAVGHLVFSPTEDRA
jgi:AcrR family transcriptional regulator